MLNRNRAVDDDPTVARRDDADAYRNEQEHVIEDRSARAPWTVAQLVGLPIGLWFAILGVAALLKTGFPTSHIYTPHDVVWTFPHSPIFALAEIAFGVLLVLASVVPGGAPAIIALLGAIAVGFGVIVLTNVSTTKLPHWTGAIHRTGWLYVILGGVLILGAIVSPLVTPSRYRRHRAVDVTRTA
jgi:hypothetical protein